MSRPLPNLPPPGPPVPPAGGSTGPLPRRTTVAVLGGGVAALAVGARLAEASTDVVIMHRGAFFGDGIGRRDAGRVAAGLAEHPHRLVAAVGLQPASEIYRFTDENRALLHAGGWLHTAFGLNAAFDAEESDEVAAASAALEAMGRGASPQPARDVDAALGGRGFGPGRIDPTEAQVRPRDVLQALWDRAKDAGAQLVTNAQVTGLRDTVDGTRVVLTQGELAADVIVLADGWRTRDVDPWFADKVHPVRVHYRRYAPAGGPATPGFSAQQGWFFGGRDAEDGLIVSGARWATPHLEVLESDDTIVQEHVDTALGGLVERRLPRWATAGLTHRWSAIAAATCDQLPIIGPLPGRANIVACCGWNGRPWSLAMRAAQAVSDGLLGLPSPAIPRLFSARRLM
jgi:glycine/D-amino acid oxidase-like deaminating enzyme